MSFKGTKKLFEILPGGIIYHSVGSEDVTIEDINIDSRLVSKGHVYAAFKGQVSDGHLYIRQAIDKGAVCIVAEAVDQYVEGITYLITKDVRAFVGAMLYQFYDGQSDQVRLIGVTGTNGKTTVATLLFQLLSQLGYTCGLISTVQNRIGQKVIPSTHTTPDVVQLHALIAEMVQEKCTFVLMEVSSHAVDQQRIAGLHFEGAIFTNITHDHLDYHGTMKHYIEAKKKFFDQLLPSAFALINLDDKNGLVMMQNTRAKKMTYSLRTMADFKVKVVESSVEGLHLKINERETFFRLIGAFNAYNIAAVYGAAMAVGCDSDDVLAILSGLRGAEGRFEKVVNVNTGTCGIIDYAHTPDALKNVLETILKVKNNQNQIITVVGCGGDRDVTKRPIMARIACEYSTIAIFTSDNPRSEDPDAILDDMENGLNEVDKSKMIRMSDRKQAIKTAVMMSKPGDIILVAGKGHENYQEIKGEKFPFDDKKILSELLG